LEFDEYTLERSQDQYVDYDAYRGSVTGVSKVDGGVLRNPKED